VGRRIIMKKGRTNRVPENKRGGKGREWVAEGPERKRIRESYGERKKDVVERVEKAESFVVSVHYGSSAVGACT